MTKLPNYFLVKISMKKIFIGIVTIFTLFGCEAAYSQETASSPKFKQDFLSYINRARAQGCNCGVDYMPPAPPLTWNYQLESAALGHALDMANKGYFNHTSLDGRTMQTRINESGYTMNGYRGIKVGENIAFGQQSIAEVMAGWLKSPGHCRNLMDPSFKEIGIAEDNKYWVQDFGGRVPFTAEEQRELKSGRYKIVHD
jgi:uncharacterized protein YkwD